jgi:hypothetical protein
MKFEEVIKAAHGVRFTRKKWAADVWITQFKFHVLLGIPKDAKIHEYEFFGGNDIRQLKLPVMFLKSLGKDSLVAWYPEQEDALANDWIKINPKMDEIIKAAKHNGSLPDEAPGDDWEHVKLDSIDDLDNIQHLMHSKYAAMLDDENMRETLKGDIEVGCSFIFWIEERKIIFER